MAIPVIYIDVVWLVNLLMDGVLLAVTCWIVKRPIRTRRLLFGAIFGAFYSLLIFVPSLSALTTWPGKAVASLLMVMLAIGQKNWLDLARTCVFFYFVSFLFAGAAIALNFAIPGVSIAKMTVVSNRSIQYTTTAASLALLVSIPICFALLKYVLRRMRQIRLREGLEYTVRISVAGQTCAFTGLIDSGNQLRDPVTRRPVCFVDCAAVQALLPKSLNEAIAKNADLVTALSEVTEAEWSGVFSLVPFRGAGGITQIAVAFRPNEVVLQRQNQILKVHETCLFALSPEKLSADHRFQAILHMELVTGDDEFEADLEHQGRQSEVANSTTAHLDTDSSKITGWR